MAVKKGLGRGLDILIPKDDKNQKNNAEKKSKTGTAAKADVNNSNNHSNNESEKENNTESVIYDQLVDINLIEPNRDQPRKQFDEDAIDELAESIKQFGVIQPLIVKKKDKYYEIIAGERRWRASKRAGVKKVPVILRDYDDAEILKISLIENLQREDLNPIEEARAYQRLKDEYKLKQDEIASSVSKSRTAITNTMRLLKLTDKVQKMIMDNLISSGHGRTLIPITNDELQYQTALKIMDESLSVREAERLVKKIMEKKDDSPEEKDQVNPMFDFYEGKMKDIFGTKVMIKNKKNNRGKIEIEYYSSAELERIIDMIQSLRIDKKE